MLNRYNELSKLKILVVEPEQDMRFIYQIIFEPIGLKVVIVENGSQCLNKITKRNYNEKNQDNGFMMKQYDIVIIDTHIRDFAVLYIAKEILCKFPNQMIILTTTLSGDTVKAISAPLGIDTEYILQKPFEMHRLFALIEKGNKKITRE